MDNFWILFLLFTAYSFLGWLCESIFCSIPAGKWINRGFLNGPFCPIYGVGGILVATLLSPFAHDLFLLYFAGVMITTALEYVTGFALEKIFHTKYWDYSEHRFNFQGRICLDNSLLFGVMCVVGMKLIHPALLYLLQRIPGRALPLLAGAFILYFICDTLLTLRTVLQLNGKLRELQLILDEIKQRASAATSETIENLQAAFASLLDDDTREALKALFERKEKLEGVGKGVQRLIRAFPTMKSVPNNESLQRIRKAIAERTRRIKYK
jgi:uncharacterized membrane protein